MTRPMSSARAAFRRMRLDLGNFREITIKPGHSGLVQVSVRLSPAVAAQTQRFDLVITPQGKPAEARV